MKRGEQSKAGVKKRKTKQRTVKRYMELREDLQVAGKILVEPTGAVREERVDPSTQDEQRFPGLDRLVIREEQKGKWHVPDHVARKVVEVSAEVLFEKKTVWVNSKEVPVEPNRVEQLAAARVLQAADNAQFDRDHPEEAGKAKGGVNVNQQVAVIDWDVVVGDKEDPVERRMRELEALAMAREAERQVTSNEGANDDEQTKTSYDSQEDSQG